MAGRFKEHIDYRTVIYQALIGYLETTGDPDLHDQRDVRLINIYPLLRVWAKGTYKGKEYDLTKEFKELGKKREESKQAKEQIKIDAERLGVLVEIMEKAGLLPQRIPVYGLGVEHPEEIDEMIEDD